MLILKNWIMEERFCLHCRGRVRGRSDKKFCSDSCRNMHNNQLNSTANAIIRNVNITLLKNRRLLGMFLGDEVRLVISRESMLLKGFNFEYFTKRFVDNDGYTYFFVYEYGYFALSAEEFVIVKDPALDEGELD